MASFGATLEAMKWLISSVVYVAVATIGLTLSFTAHPYTLTVSPGCTAGPEYHEVLGTAQRMAIYCGFASASLLSFGITAIGDCKDLSRLALGKRRFVKGLMVLGMLFYIAFLVCCIIALALAVQIRTQVFACTTSFMISCYLTAVAVAVVPTIGCIFMIIYFVVVT